MLLGVFTGHRPIPNVTRRPEPAPRTSLKEGEQGLRHLRRAPAIAQDGQDLRGGRARGQLCVSPINYGPVAWLGGNNALEAIHLMGDIQGAEPGELRLGNSEG